MALQRSDVLDVLKEFYPDNFAVPKTVVYRKAPFFAMVEKDEEASGEFYKVPLSYGNPQGRSADFAKAQTNQKPSKWAGFNCTYVDDYSVASIRGNVIDATRNDRGSFVRHVKAEFDGAIHQLKRSAHHAIFRNGGGSLGQISTDSTVASATIKLAQVSDVVFFEVGQILKASDTDGTSGALRAGSAEISAINRETGELTTAGGNWSTQITGLAVSDHLFVDGDFGAKMKGLDAWIPATAPTGGDSFYGTDRSKDPTRLAGVRYDGSSQNVEEALIDGCEMVTRHGGEPEIVVLHPKQFARLVKLLGSRVVYDKRMSEDGTVGFRVLKLVLDSAEMDIVSDPNCQVNVAWMLQLETLVLASMGRVPKLIDDDGQPALREANNDGIEGRNVYRATFACNAPGWNGRIKLAA